MDTPKRIPWSVRIVAYLFALGGIGSLVEFGIGLFTSQPFDLSELLWGVLEINIAAGLLDFNRFWRIVALVWLGVQVTLSFIYILLALLPAPEQTTFDLQFADYTFSEAPIPKAVAAAWIILYFTFLIWEWWVLGRPAAQKLFWQKPQSNLTTATSPIRSIR